jgi:hypothetical protein
VTAGAIKRAAARVYFGNGWPAEELDDGIGFSLEIDGTDASWSALALTDDDSFTFYSLSPVEFPNDRIGQVAEFLHRANHGLLTGTFELDYDTAEVRLRTGIELGTLAPSALDDDDALDMIVLDLSAANVGIFDQYLSGLVAVCVGNGAAADIIREIEESTD